MVFHYCLEKDIPILGICRGIQIINVLMGGTLYQDLPSQYAGTTPDGRHIEHHMHPPYDQVQHWNTLCPGSPLHSLLQKDRLGVNSYHHQAIKDPGHDIRVMAMSEDGLIEGIYVPDRSFIWGIQWHPEFSCQNDEDSLKIFRAFICACS